MRDKFPSNAETTASRTRLEVFNATLSCFHLIGEIIDRLQF